MIASKATTDALEHSFAHYLEWMGAQVKHQDAAAAETNENGENIKNENDEPEKNNAVHEALAAKYKRVLDVLREEFNHVSQSDTPNLPSTVPLVLARWSRGADIDAEAESTPGKQGKKASNLWRRPDIPEDVKDMLLSMRKENHETKKKIFLLESKLMRTEQRLETQQEKLREEAKNKVAKMKSRFMKKKEKLEQQAQKMKEAKKRKREEKLKASAPAKKHMKWEERYDQLLVFYKEHGHTKVARNYPKNPSLAEWVSDQRKYYRKKAPILTKERIEKMEAIGFVWNPPTSQKTFESRIEECKEFLSKYGHLNIPQMNEKHLDGTEPTEKEKSFRLWATGIRNQYRRRSVEGIHNKLDKIRMKALEEIGFVWGLGNEAPEVKAPHEDRFIDRVEQLKKVKELYGTCNDKKSIYGAFPDNPSLYIWVKTQRKMYRRWKNGQKSSLTEERREMLREIGFDFEPRKHYNPPTKKKKMEDGAIDATPTDETGDMVLRDDVDDDSEPGETAYL